MKAQQQNIGGRPPHKTQKTKSQYRADREIIRRATRDGADFHCHKFDLGMFDTTYRRRRCACGNVWRPIVISGRCPECKRQDSRAEPLDAQEIAALRELRSLNPSRLNPLDFQKLKRVHQLRNWLEERGAFEVGVNRLEPVSPRSESPTCCSTS